MLKAIDAQQVIIQIEHAARVQQQHPEVQQRYLQVQTQEERRLMQERVRNAEEADRARIRGDEKRENRHSGGGTPDKGKEGTPQREAGLEEPQKADQPEGHINITV
jgi:hypothetical protein